MSERDTLHLYIRDAAEMRALGHALAVHFLTPLIDTQPVVALYGSKASGKSALIDGINKLFPEFDLLWRSTSNEMRSQLEGGLALASDGKLYRHQDFGEQTYSDTHCADPSAQPMSWIGPIKPRKEITSFSKAGFDVLEHPPIPHLAEAQIVVSIGCADLRNHRTESQYNGAKTESLDYFEEMANTIIKNGTNERTKKAAGEMRKILKHMTISPKNSWDAIAHDLMSRKARYVTLTLTEDTPETQKAFDRLRDALGSSVIKKDFASLSVTEEVRRSLRRVLKRPLSAIGLMR